MSKIWPIIVVSCLGYHAGFSQALDFTAIRAEVDFSRTLQEWDGFGFNYVETAHSSDMEKFNQEYGGFSLLDDNEKREIITTLYGPPGYTTKQKVHRGRDLDPEYKDAVADYMVDWVKFLREEEGLPVKWLSLHNEGEDWRRWNQQGFTEFEGHDYNLFWPPEQVNDFVKLMPGKLEAAGLGDVGITPGETSNWFRFGTWGYVEALLLDREALKQLDLITSHGFYGGNYGRWFGEHKSAGIDRLRAERPELHAWVTSFWMPPPDL